MTTLRVIIADDEPLARKRLRTLLRDQPDVEVVAESATGRDAAAAISRHRPDLVFLDIQMPDLDGFGVIESVGEANGPAVIFVTAYDAHALRAFEVNALDYLLKPFDEQRLAAALARARRLFELRGRDEAAFRERLLGAIADLKTGGGYRTRLAVKSAGRVYFLTTEDIDWIDAAGKYVRVHVRGVEHLHRVSISRIGSDLDPAHFARIHRSTIVNLSRIKELQPLFHGEYVVILHDGTELTLSRGYRRKLAHLLDGCR